MLQILSKNTSSVVNADIKNLSGSGWRWLGSRSGSELKEKSGSGSKLKEKIVSGSEPKEKNGSRSELKEKTGFGSESRKTPGSFQI